MWNVRGLGIKESPVFLAWTATGGAGFYKNTWMKPRSAFQYSVHRTIRREIKRANMCKVETDFKIETGNELRHNWGKMDCGSLCGQQSETSRSQIQTLLLSCKTIFRKSVTFFISKFPLVQNGRVYNYYGWRCWNVKTLELELNLSSWEIL